MRSVAGRLPPGVKRCQERCASGRYPDFIGIGAQKAGTTWLGRNLRLHPEIWMPGIKELHYFNERINDPKNLISTALRQDNGRRHREPALAPAGQESPPTPPEPVLQEDFLWDLRYYAGAPGDGWYASLFEPGRGKVKGEITPAYSMLGRDSIARVHDLVPEAKLIFMMRNP